MTKEKPNFIDGKLEDQPELVRERRMLSFLMSKKIPPVPSDDERKPYGEYHTNILSRLMFWWLNPILQIGYKRTIKNNDLFYLEEKQQTDYLYNRFRTFYDAAMRKEIDQFLTEKFEKEGKTYNPEDGFDDEDLIDFKLSTKVIPICLFKTLRIEYSTGVIFKILSDSTNATTPLLQKKLINFVSLKSMGFNPYIGTGVGYAIGVCLMIFFASVTVNSAFYNLQMTGAKTRAILTRLLLDKSLSVDARGNHLYVDSKIQSMVSTDLNRVDLAIGYFPFLLTIPIPIGICIGLLIWNIGPSALVGIGIFIAIVMFLGICIKRLLKVRFQAAKYTDIRVGLMKELLKNYKMIKFYSWENSYQDRIQSARFSEMRYLLKLQSLRNVLISVALSMPVLASMATFCTAYDVAGAKSSAQIFSSLSLFQVLAIQFMLAPMALASTTDLVASIRKMCGFLSCADKDPAQFQISHFQNDKIALKVENATFQWDKFDDDDDDTNNKTESKKGKTNKENDEKNQQASSDFNSQDDATTDNLSTEKETNISDIVEKTEFPGLNNINLEIRKGEFVVVTGLIGSGKSSLLNAMSGLMKRTEGNVYVDGDLLLCGYPWIQNETIRDNITFGLPYDEKKYNKIIYACSLIDDFKQFPGGDLTEVGERGITLSGGQKARINLARSIYADKDILLLDDVLSAVDAKVGKHIVEKCILGILKDKTRVMATHQLSLIDSADRMIFLNGDGTVDIGTIDELKKRNTKLEELLQFQLENVDDTDVEEESIMDLHSKISMAGSVTQYNEIKESQEIKEQKVILELAKTNTVKTEINTDSSNNEVVRIVGDEERAVNSLKFDVYWNYGRLAFGKFPIFSPILFVSTAIVSTFCNYFTNTWLSFWIDQKFPGRPVAFYMGIYVMFAFLYTFFLSFYFYIMCYFGNSAAKRLNFRASQKILHVPMAFMDISPIGRVLNRFTKDTDTVDNELIEQVRQFLSPFCNTVGTIILCIIYIPWFAIAVPLIIGFYVVAANYYQASAREIKRLEAVKRSFVYSHFNETLSGKETIKAYKKEEDSKKKLGILINEQNEAYFITLAIQRWLGANLAILSFIIVFIISMLCVFRVFKINAASAGLLLTYVINVTGILTMMMRALTQVENEFNSVERLNHYAFHVEQEAPYEIPENDPPESWPENGEIKFENVSMKYRPELPYILKDLSITISKNEKIGFCGRTGAGKSTFMTCLYRLTEFEGKIAIDEVDIKQLGLHKLRSKLTIIPQDPVLFVGTIRENLDPFNEYSDDKLWDTLSISGLINKSDLNNIKIQTKDDENLHKFHLNRYVEDDGSNFSIGERQLIALARALVRKTKILILDEATSSVDYETDSKIQNTISTEFKDCTILCIAHRLNTILNYDRIVVMDEGKVVEFDKPKTLFMNKSGHFRSMCDQANITINDF